MNNKISIFAKLILLVLVFTSCGKEENTIDFSLIPYRSDEGKWGFIDKEGKIIINPQFRAAYPFTESLAGVENENGDMGFIDKEGKISINPQYEFVVPFSEGLALVSKEGSPLSYINKKGELKITIKGVERASSFSNELAVVVKRNDEGQLLYGYINKEGKTVINYQFYDAFLFKNDKAFVSNKDGKYGIINKEGKFIVNPQFNEVKEFQDGLAPVSDGKKWGYIDESGKYAINPQFERAEPFSEGLAVVMMGEKSYGYIDKEGKIKINPQFSYAGSFKNGLALVSTGGKDQYGYIDKKGKIKINPQFEQGFPFYSDFAVVKSSGKWGTIDKEGKFIANPQFRKIFILEEQLASHKPMFVTSSEKSLQSENEATDTDGGGSEDDVEPAESAESAKASTSRNVKAALYTDYNTGEIIKIDSRGAISYQRSRQAASVSLIKQSSNGDGEVVVRFPGRYSVYKLNIYDSIVFCTNPDGTVQRFILVEE